MAYRIVAKSPEKLDDILTDIKEWFTSTKDYVAKLDTEKRKFADPATKQIVSKDIDIIYVKDMTTKKETKIMLIPLLKPGEMKVEIGGENEHVMKGKIKNMMKGRGDFKSYNKDTLRKMEAVETVRNIIREEYKKSQLQQINKEEVRLALKEDANLMRAVPMLLNPVGQMLGYRSLLGQALDFSDDRSLIQRIQDWWQSKKDNKVMNQIAARIKDDPDIQAFVKNPRKPGWRRMLASKLTPEEQRYVSKLYRVRFKDLD